MRIIAGEWRSRRLERPRTVHTRPMPQRMREAIFDILGSHYATPGTLPPIRVADFFAGSGSLGLEAVSRGAAACDAIDNRLPALEALRENVRALGAADRVRVWRANAWTCCLTQPAPQQRYGLVFLDPPFRDARDTSPTGRVPRLLADLERARWLDGEAIVVMHHEDSVAYAAGPTGWWMVGDRRTYGTGAVTIVQRRPSAPCDAAPPPVAPASDEDAPREAS